MLIDEVRANEFDRWVGGLQAKKTMELGTGTSLLDVGCGVGMFTPIFLKKFKRVVGLDPSEEYINEAQSKNTKIEFVRGYGETFELTEKFDTIVMSNILEHVDNPVKILKNCKRHLAVGGKIIAHVPNAITPTRELGVLMGIIPTIAHITKKEKNYYGHQRVYILETLEADAISAGLQVIKKGGVLWKPLPNEILLKICKEKGPAWSKKFLNALCAYGETRPNECAGIYIVCE